MVKKMKTIKKILKINIFITLLLLTLYISLYIYARFKEKPSIKIANNYTFYDINNNIYNNENNWTKLEDIS